MPFLQENLYEEATLLRERELELKAKLSGLPEAAPVVPVVTVQHIEQVCAGCLWLLWAENVQLSWGRCLLAGATATAADSCFATSRCAGGVCLDGHPCGAHEPGREAEAAELGRRAAGK